MRVLAIETSCDETAAAVVSGPPPRVESNVVASQIDLHKKYGGVFPELASRAHTESIIPVIEEALRSSEKIRTKNEKKSSLLGFCSSLADIDAIAVTIGPGLLGSLLVGVNAARSLAMATEKPIVPVNHLEGHIYANFIAAPSAQFPVLALTVAGGHTQLVLMTNHLNYRVLGKTRDDSAGEAFDKIAKLLGLDYPGGPAIEKIAKEGQPNAFVFPRGMIDDESFDFSFSGLKTAVLYKVHELTRGRANEKKLVSSSTGQLINSLPRQLIADLAASFQQAVIDVLVEKTIRAARRFRPLSIFLSGGVAANRLLRGKLKERLKIEFPTIFLAIPESSYCTDNAAMIGAAAIYMVSADRLVSWEKVGTDPNATLEPVAATK
jgi:N6-L-threonylcarbamoyladenine synthase